MVVTKKNDRHLRKGLPKDHKQGTPTSKVRVLLKRSFQGQPTNALEDHFLLLQAASCHPKFIPGAIGLLWRFKKNKPRLFPI
jgi:hypothetical protein